MTTNNELLPCPFCGGKAAISTNHSESLWSHDVVLWTQVSCESCEASMPQTCDGYEVEAVEAWNTRRITGE